MKTIRQLVLYHKKVYGLISEFDNFINSTDKTSVLKEIKKFKKNVKKIIDKHFEQEEKVVFAKLLKESHYKSSPAAQMLNEHKTITRYHDLLDELIYKYEKHPATITYEAIIELSKKLRDELYHNSIFEDTALFKFVGIKLNQKKSA